MTVYLLGFFTALFLVIVGELLKESVKSKKFLYILTGIVFLATCVSAINDRSIKREQGDLNQLKVEVKKWVERIDDYYLSNFDHGLLIDSRIIQRHFYVDKDRHIKKQTLHKIINELIDEGKLIATRRDTKCRHKVLREGNLAEKVLTITVEANKDYGITDLYRPSINNAKQNISLICLCDESQELDILCSESEILKKEMVEGKEVDVFPLEFTQSGFQFFNLHEYKWGEDE